jgi:hypothetical protein
MRLEKEVIEVLESVDTSRVTREKVSGLIRRKRHDRAGMVVVRVLCSGCLVVKVNHSPTGCSVSIYTGHEGRVVDCQVGGAREGVVEEQDWSSGSKVISNKGNDMVVVRRGLKGAIGESTEGVSDLNVIGVSFKDEGNGDGSALR